ncbi:hypothetical protein ASD06_08605 [Angustibacter sp. Root456]|nr:hypothetical protein ASD06_08605 [Angustibacter sp. Root456]
MALGWLRSRGFVGALVVAAATAIAGGVAADTTLQLPLVQRSLPLPVVVLLVAVIVVVTPIQDRFGGLEASLERRRTDRLLAGALACSLAVVACGPAAMSARERLPWSVFVGLLVVAVMAVVVVGAFAWLPTVVVGLAVTYVDLVYGQPVRSALDTVGLPVLSALLMAALGLYVLRGPSDLGAH